MNTRTAILGLVMVASLGAAVPSSSGATGQADLESGEALLEYTQTEASGGAARITLLMYTSAPAIWAILTSCEQTFAYVDGLRECEVLEGGLEWQRVRQSVKKHWLLPQLDYVIEFSRKPYTAIEFRRTEGDLRLLEGSWQFEAEAEGITRVTHEIRVQPTFPVPRWLVRRTLAADLPHMLQCLRALSGGSGSQEQSTQDRAQCPKPTPDR